jgi:hypothetical protein
LATLAFGRTAVVAGQESGPWPLPQRIPEFHSETWPPVLLTDPGGVIHAFSYQYLRSAENLSERAIMYNSWTPSLGWTMPVDILLSPLSNDARLLDAELDAAGRVHLIFWGGTNVQANLYYSQAPLAEAAKASAWAAPVLVAENAGDPEAGSLLIESDNTYGVLFSGRQEGSGLYLSQSADCGLTWSRPRMVASTHERSRLVQVLHVVTGTDGAVHAVWNEVTPEGQGRGIYYMRQAAVDRQWSEAVLLARAEAGLGTQTPAAIEYDEQIVVFFNQDSRIWMRTTADGYTWTAPQQLFGRHEGVNGALSPLVDANDQLHLFFGQRMPGSPSIHGLWHSRWDGLRWSEPEPVVLGPPVADQVGDQAFDPYQARAHLTHDNIALVTWRTDPGNSGNGVWYSWNSLGAAPTLAAASGTAAPPSPTPLSSVEMPGEYATTPVPATAIALAGVGAPPGHPTPRSPAASLAFGIVPVLLVVSTVTGCVLFIRHYRIRPS